MPIAAFDTMGVADRLSRDFDVPEKQARGIARVLHENFVGNVATKDDIAAIRKDSRHLDEKLTEKIDRVEERLTGEIRRVDGRITQLEEKLIGVEEKMIGEIGRMGDRFASQLFRHLYIVAFGIVGLTFAMIKLFL